MGRGGFRDTHGAMALKLDKATELVPHHSEAHGLGEQALEGDMSGLDFTFVFYELCNH